MAVADPALTVDGRNGVSRRCFDNVVLDLPLDQLVIRVDPGSPRLPRYGDADRLLTASYAVLFQVQRLTEAVAFAGREDANLYKSSIGASVSLPMLSALIFLATMSSVTWYSPLPIGSTMACLASTSQSVTCSNRSVSRCWNVSGVTARNSA